MTPTERTKSIKAAYTKFGWTSKWFDFIAAQIAEAEREAYKRGERSQKSCEKSYAEGFRAGEQTHLATCSERFDEGFRAGKEEGLSLKDVPAAIGIARRNGFNAAREKAMGIVRIIDGETRTRLDLERDIGEMDP